MTSPDRRESEGTPQPLATCPVCCMEIPARAGRCPYCQEPLGPGGKARRGIFIIGSCLLTVVLIAGASYLAWFVFRLFAPQSGTVSYRGQIEIEGVELETHPGRDGQADEIEVTGRMQNPAEVDWQNICFHVEFRDAGGSVIHAQQVEDRYRSLPAKHKLFFVLHLEAQADLERYHSVSVRVVEAEPAMSDLFLDLW